MIILDFFLGGLSGIYIWFMPFLFVFFLGIMIERIVAKEKVGWMPFAAGCSLFLMVAPIYYIVSYY